MKRLILLILPIISGCVDKMQEDNGQNTTADNLIQTVTKDSNSLPQEEIVINLPIDGTLNDISPFKHKIKSRGGMYVKDRKGVDSSAYYLNGVNQYLLVPFHKGLYNKTYTLSIWVNIKEFPDTNKGYSHVFGCFDHHVGEWGTQIWIGTEEVGGSIGGGKNDHLLLSSSNLDSCGVKVGKWHHLALVHNEHTGDFQIYVDGKAGEVPNHYGSGGAFEGDDNVQWKKAFEWAIGDIPSYIYHANPVTRSYNGAVDEVKLFNYQLTEEEIMQLAMDK